MALRNIHPRTDLLRYVDGTVEGHEKRALEEHLATCKECQEYLSFARGFNEGLADLTEEEFTSQEPCPDSWTLMSYQAGDVDEETAHHLRAHLLFCDECREEFFALRRLSREESWREVIARLKEFVIDLMKTYGPGTLVGPIRIVAEQPALAVRGGELPKPISKVLQTSVADNTYSIELGVTKEGSVSCDIAGVRTPVKVSLGISIRSETGGELLTTQTDEFGNSHFVLPSVPDDLILLTLNLEGDEQQILFRVPEAQKPA